MEVRICIVIGRSVLPTLSNLSIHALPGVIYVIQHGAFRCPMPSRRNPRGPFKCFEVWRDADSRVMARRNDGSVFEVRV